jgi:hypothetical protein
MRFSVLLFTVFTTGLVVGYLLPSNAANPSNQTQEVVLLLQQLEDSRFSVREKAEKQLLKMGLEIVPQLREATPKLSVDAQNRLKKIVGELTRLPWFLTAKEGIEQAQKENKPLLIFSTIGEPNGFA